MTRGHWLCPFTLQGTEQNRQIADSHSWRQPSGPRTRNCTMAPPCSAAMGQTSCWRLLSKREILWRKRRNIQLQRVAQSSSRHLPKIMDSMLKPKTLKAYSAKIMDSILQLV